MTGFTMERRERFLALLSVGHTVESAAAVAGTSRQTVVRWAARGRVPGAPAEAAGFAQRLDAIRGGKAEDVARHREAEAEAEPPPDHPWRWVLDGDPFVSEEPAAMAMLTPEQQEQARAVTQASWADRDAERAAERLAQDNGRGPR